MAEGLVESGMLRVLHDMTDGQKDRVAHDDDDGDDDDDDHDDEDDDDMMMVLLLMMRMRMVCTHNETYQSDGSYESGSCR
jgi:hypothetical protein